MGQKGRCRSRPDQARLARPDAIAGKIRTDAVCVCVCARACVLLHERAGPGHRAVLRPPPAATTSMMMAMTMMTRASIATIAV